MKSKSYARERTKKELVEGGEKYVGVLCHFIGQNAVEYSTAATTSSSMYLLTLTVKSLGQHFQNTSSGDKKQHLIFYVIYL